MVEYIQVLTTVDSKERAEEITKRLLEERLAACIQIIGPIVSFYWWRQKIETSQEWICLIKTESAKYKDIEKMIKELHNYETPEIIAIPITTGYSRYLEWISSEVAERY